VDERRPWLRFYGDVPETLDYPPVRLDEIVARSAQRFPRLTAYHFLGRTATYAQLHEAIERCAAGLAAQGVRAGDRVTIALPTSPQGVVAFYAVSRVGAVSSMIHPLSTPEEIEHYLNLSRSRLAITLDSLHGRFAEVRARTALKTIVLTRISDELPPVKRLGYWATTGRKAQGVPRTADVVWWRELINGGAPPPPAPRTKADELGTIFYSSGTTGAPKGIMLSHRGVTSEALQVSAWVSLGERDVILAVLPIFHGFGLAALIHAGLASGAKLVLLPRFSPAAVAKVMRSEHPTVMAGVPTLYEALAHHPGLRRADLSMLRATYSGADTLQPSVREAFEQLVRERGGSVRLLEGYGLTESVTAIMCNPLHRPRDGSVGIPFPDMLAKICEPGTDRELAPGEEGEICVSGPPVMLGYLDNPTATAKTLKIHADGRTWLHTEDIGSVDDEGYFSFASRLKRMIKSSGFNVYPAQVEAVLDEHPAVRASCVVGVPDAAQGERVKAFVIAQDEAAAGEALAGELIAYCQSRLIKWSCPREIEFRSKLPLTRLGKIDYVALSREAEAHATTDASQTELQTLEA
jgi:long-chain acyl-CoA synthetase